MAAQGAHNPPPIMATGELNEATGELNEATGELNESGLGIYLSRRHTQQELDACMYMHSTDLGHSHLALERHPPVVL